LKQVHPWTDRQRMKATVAAALLTVSLMAGELISGQSPPQKFVPNPAKLSDLMVRLDPVGKMPTTINPNSPVVASKTADGWRRS
jgi:hypothetical protein